MPPTSPTTTFLARARTEAQRLGADRWVFVRELLQNARDAAATRVTLSVDEGRAGARVACRDDGAGMSFEHAARFLFRLYASSKERDTRQAGRFGVGFWSVLLLAPTRLLVRSWPSTGQPWEIEIDGTLSRTVRRLPPRRHGTGTEIVIECGEGHSDGQLARRVADAAWQSARFLAQRDHPRRPVAILVNGHAVNAAFGLPPPSVAFSSARERGTLGLGPAPRVELFSKGLRLRAAVALDDLLQPLGPVAAHTRLRFDELRQGVAPVALIESQALEPLLARGDARENRALRRLVGRARRALRRLVEEQLEAAHPRRLWRRVGDALEAALPGPLLAWAGAAVAAAALAALGLWWAMGSTPVGGPAPVRPEPSQPRVLRDLAGSYTGPGVDTGAGLQLLALRYSPASASPLLAALVVPDPDAAPAARPIAPPLSAYAPPQCLAAGLDLSIAAAGSGPFRLPVPTGQRIDPTSVRLGSRPATLYASALDEPVLVLPSGSSAWRIHYRTCPAVAPRLPGPRRLPTGSVLIPIASNLATTPRARRPAAALAWVRERVAYSTTPTVAERHTELRARGLRLAERTLAIGAGDCDVQNGLLAQLLGAADVPARLVVGYVGRGGMAFGLHAWVEHRLAADEPWQVLDASVSSRETPDGERRPTGPPNSAARVASPLTGRTLVPWAAGAAIALAGLVLLAVRGRGGSLRVRLPEVVDLAPILQGALERPEAFGDSPAVFQRAVIPTLGGRVSLSATWEMASRSRLFVSRRGSSLARRAARRGAMVLDARQAEAAGVGESLGAIDLDGWDDLLARARPSRLLDAAARALRRVEPHLTLAGIDPPLEGASAPGPALAVLDLPAPSIVRRRRVERRVLVERGPWLKALEEHHARHPAEAVFTVVDLLVERFGMDARGRRLRSSLARRAMQEGLDR